MKTTFEAGVLRSLFPPSFKDRSALSLLTTFILLHGTLIRVQRVKAIQGSFHLLLPLKKRARWRVFGKKKEKEGVLVVQSIVVPIM